MPASRSSPRSRPLGWSVGVVGLIAGIMFATNASLFATAPDERRPQNLAQLIHLERERLDETNKEVEQLRSEVAELIKNQTPISQPSLGTEIAAGRVAVDGPGAVVKLWDAPLRDPLPEGVGPDDLIVHQQDLESVINALWAGGAEAMAVQGHRVTSRSSIRCVGNVLLIDGSVYSPPYEISAVGDPRSLEAAVMSSPQILTYLDYVEALQLGWSLETTDELHIAADKGSITINYAALPGSDSASLTSDSRSTAPASPSGEGIR